MAIDVDTLSVTEITDQWKNGNRNSVVRYLRSLPQNTCHIVAFVTLAIYKEQGECQANALVNMLMDKYIETR